MLRDGGTYVEMGQFTDAGAIETNWHRICTKDLNVLGSWAFHRNDIPRDSDAPPGSRPLSVVGDADPLRVHRAGIGEAIESAIEMRSVKSTIVPTPDLIDD